jgi:thiosulfate/3-mercaptopyruvate sulfurtransferase
MKPNTQQFSIAMDLMQITPSDTLYIYANQGCAFAHRAYWTFTSFHDPKKVKLVQGSLEEWELQGGVLDTTELSNDDERLFRLPNNWEEQTPIYTYYEVKNTVDMNEMMDIVTNQSAVVVDARSSGRFVGKDPEPRPGLRGGHMPHALNVPFVSLLMEADLTKFKPLHEVRQIFIEAGIKPYEESSDKEKKIVCSCGSGVTAAALAVGLEECGLRRKDDILIYDGSWIEWGGDSKTPIVKNL